MFRVNLLQGKIFIISSVFLILALLSDASIQGADQDRGRQDASVAPSTLGIEQGFLEFNTPDFYLKLVKASQTVATLKPREADGFDFTPGDRLESRASDGFYHLGDLTLRIRAGGSDSWQKFSTATARESVKSLNVSLPALAAADLSPTLPADFPLQVTRTWLLDGDRLILSFELRNRGDESVQIGSLGIPMPFNNIITNRSLEQAHRICSFSDPYVGRDAGYLQVTRLTGKGPALVVAPHGKTPFEAWQLLPEPMRPTQTFEGAYEWLVHTKAYAENEWIGADPWNPPTTITLLPGQVRTYGVKFLVSDEIRNIEKTLMANNRPVAIGIPGYILPMDLDAKLFLHYGPAVTAMKVEPEGAVAISVNSPTKNGWRAYTLQGRKWGRARLTVTYADGTDQAIHFYVIKPAAQAVDDMGSFLFNRQWYVNPDDHFGRSGSIMSYDREADRIVTQDSRVWIAGLQDEGGAGSWVAAAMKQFVRPDREELNKFEQFIDNVLWGGIQYSEGENIYGVRKSMFYYEPNELPESYYRDDLNWTSWTSWDKKHAGSIGRAYNYPHVVAAYWSMYRLARNTIGLVANHSWEWYLDHAYQTCRFLTERDENGRPRVGYLNTGLMEGDIFVMVLEDMKREGWKDKAADLEARMKQRADRWNGDAYPFGSEMAWDSTGQEEVFAWCKYFGYDDKALVSLHSILGYMPTVPHWGYNGNARRYWDFLYGGAPGRTSRIERQIHHYGSGINAIPVLAQYREQPDDFHLLRIGYGGTMGAISNIDREGFASAAFHSFPATLKWDSYSGDYGPNFFGHAVNTATYVIRHPEFGWQAFGGNVTVDSGSVSVKPLDSMRRRIYVAPLGLWLRLDAGMFDSVRIDPAGRTVYLGLTAATKYTPVARLRIEQPAEVNGVGTFRPAEKEQIQRGAYLIPLASEVSYIKLICSNPD